MSLSHACRSEALGTASGKHHRYRPVLRRVAGEPAPYRAATAGVGDWAGAVLQDSRVFEPPAPAFANSSMAGCAQRQPKPAGDVRIVEVRTHQPARRADPVPQRVAVNAKISSGVLPPTTVA